MRTSTSPKRSIALTVFLVLFTVAAFGAPPDYAAIEARVYATMVPWRDEITRWSGAFDVDPRLVAAILYVEKVQYLLDDWLRFRDGIESATAELEAFYAGLAEWADLSAGFTRIKPTFAAETFERLSRQTAYPVPIVREDVRPENYATDPRLSIVIMIAGIRALADEWSTAGHDVADRPEILATLYNIGYSNSHPKARPLPGGSAYPMVLNGVLVCDVCFGTRVARTMELSRALDAFFASLPDARP